MPRFLTHRTFIPPVAALLAMAALWLPTLASHAAAAPVGLFTLA